ncbi:12513_t:CDS:1, partial [Acaulospora colombiana]
MWQKDLVVKDEKRHNENDENLDYLRNLENLKGLDNWNFDNLNLEDPDNSVLDDWSLGNSRIENIDCHDFDVDEVAEVDRFQLK